MCISIRPLNPQGITKWMVKKYIGHYALHPNIILMYKKKEERERER